MRASLYGPSYLIGLTLVILLFFSVLLPLQMSCVVHVLNLINFRSEIQMC